MIRKILGFVPVLIPSVIVWIGMTDFDNPMAQGLHPGQIPWYHWLWLAASIASGILLCYRRLIPPGLITGCAPYLVILVMGFLPATSEAALLRIFAVCCLTFFIAYAVCYYVYRRELNKS